MVFFSFIIPHKNSSVLLKRLLDSIPSDPKIQIIVVDDNSSEEEFWAVQSLASCYSINLYQNEGKYGGGARNTGIKYAKGKWLLFADADDYYIPSLGQMLKKYMNCDADIVYFNVLSCYSDTLEPAYRAEHINTLFENYEKTKNPNEIKGRFLAPWSKMFSREFICKNHILYEEIIAANDLMFNALASCKAVKVICEPEPIYMITVTKGSITNTLSKDRLESRLQSVMRSNKVLRNHGLGRYQMSVLYYIGGAYQYGITYVFHVLKEIIKHRANPFIGMGKLLHAKKVWSMLQNKRVLKDERR